MANPLISLFLDTIYGGNIFKMRSLNSLVKNLTGNNLNDINISEFASLMTMALRRVNDGFVGDFLFSQLVGEWQAADKSFNQIIYGRYSMHNVIISVVFIKYEQFWCVIYTMYLVTSGGEAQ